jgi:hypothetical protein
LFAYGLDTQLEFEEAKKESNYHVGKISRSHEDEQRLFNSKVKDFKLRGFRGKDVRLQSKAEVDGPSRNASRLQVRENRSRVANKARIVAGTGGVSKFLTDNMAPHASHLKHLHRTANKTRAEKKLLRPFDIARAITNFKHRGVLPNVSVDVINAAPPLKDQDKRLLRRMIQAMLIRAGVEQNPGPNCGFAGKRIQGDCVKLHGLPFVICTNCAVKLIRLRGKVGYHPYSCGVFESGYEPCEIEDPNVWHPPITRSTSLPSLIPTVVEHPVPSPPVPTVVVPTTTLPPILPSPAAPAVSSPRLTLPVTPAVVDITLPLMGHSLTGRDCREILCGCNPYAILISEIEHIGTHLPYTGEHRLATVRNVPEIKESMTVARMSAKFFNYKPFITLCCYMVLSYVLCYTSFVWFLPCLVMLCYRFYVIRGVEFVYKATISYVPHWASCVASDYPRMVDVANARCSMRQRLQRVASLPVSDASYFKLVVGTEMVVEHLITHQSFFPEGAACFDRLPH